MYNYHQRKQRYRTSILLLQVVVVVSLTLYFSLLSLSTVFVNSFQFCNNNNNSNYNSCCNKQQHRHYNTKLYAAAHEYKKLRNNNNRNNDTCDDVHVKKLPLNTAVEQMQEIVQQQQNQQSPNNHEQIVVEVEGYVLTKRKLSRSFAFIDLSDAINSDSPVQMMLKRQDFIGASVDSANVTTTNTNDDAFVVFDVYMKCMFPGSKIRVTGTVVESRNPGEAILLTQQIALIGIPKHNSEYVRIVLQTLQQHSNNSTIITNEFVASCGYDSIQTFQNDVQQHYDADMKEVQSSRSSSIFKTLSKQIVETAKVHDDASNFPSEFLAHQHTEGKYTLPMASKHLRIPPQEVIAGSSSSSWSSSSNATVEYFGSVAHLLNTAAANPSRHRTSKNNDDDKTRTSNDEITVSMQATVQNRRRFANNITVLEVVDNYRYSSISDNGGSDSSIRIQLKGVLHTQCMVDDVRTMSVILAPGTVANFTGQLHQHSDEEIVFWITSVQLIRACWRPSVIQFILDQIVEQQRNNNIRNNNTTSPLLLDDTVCAALQISRNELHELYTVDKTARQWKAAEISRKLQSRESRMGVPDPNHIQTIQRYETVRKQYPVTPISTKDGGSGRKQEQPTTTTNTTTTVQQKFDALRQGSRWQRKKEPQLEWMTQQIQQVLQSHPDYGKRTLQIVDIGGGQGFLANRLMMMMMTNSPPAAANVQQQAATNSTTFSPFAVHVVDIDQRATRNGLRRSQRLQLPVRYTVGDASTTSHDQIDLVVALHACGVLTDVALSHAMNHNAGFVICPCCFNSNAHLRVPVVIRNTTTNSNGDSTSSAKKKQQTTNMMMDAVEFLQIQDPRDYTAIKTIAEIQGDIELANQGIHTLCAIRAKICDCDERRRTQSEVVQIRSFPMTYSTRNLCLVGSIPIINNN